MKPLHERESYLRFSRIWRAAWERNDFDFCYRCRGVYDRAWERQDAKAAKRAMRKAA